MKNPYATPKVLQGHKNPLKDLQRLNNIQGFYIFVKNLWGYWNIGTMPELFLVSSQE
jgi:hypothetical protein